MNIEHPLIEVAYLASAVLFVVGLKRLQSPATARGGNALASLAMLVAIIATGVHGSERRRRVNVSLTPSSHLAPSSRC